MFFDSYEALKLFFVQALQWEDEEDALLPDLKEFSDFVMYANPKGLLIGPDVAATLPTNGIRCIMRKWLRKRRTNFSARKGCAVDLLKYGMEHDLLPEAQFPFENGKELLHENWDFIALLVLGDVYEGE